MKVYFSVLFMLLCTGGFAQQPALADDLNPGMDKVLEKFKPGDSLDPVEFNEKIEPVRKDAYRQIKSGGDEETKLRRLDVDYRLRNLQFWYWLSHVDKGMTAAQGKYIDSQIYSNADLNNELLYRRSSAYRQWVGQYLRHKYQTKYQSDTTFKSLKGTAGREIHAYAVMPGSVVVGEVQNPFIRDYECFLHASMYLRLNIELDSVMVQSIVQDFNASITNTYYRGEMQQLYDAYRLAHSTGAPVPDFTYEAVDGNQITLSNLRGNCVFIDIWATTCHNCIDQFPYLAKVEEEYKDKNIRFVSLSTDKQADKGKWRKYVVDHKLAGYQVIADKDSQSDWIKKLNVLGIPRFILIDPAGNIVDGDAKRPSDPALKNQFDKLLK